MINLIYKDCGSARLKLNAASERFRKAEPRLWERFFDTANGKVFSAGKTIHCGEGEKRALVLMAAGPELRGALENAAERTYGRKCEFRVEAATANHFVDRMPGQAVETHFVLIDRPVPRHYVYLESQRERFSDVDTAAFGRILEGVVGGGATAAFCLELSNMLRFIEERMPRKGKEVPKLTFREEALWSAGEACDEAHALRLARLIRANGLIGSNFGYFRTPRSGLPALFDFHSHPAFLVPPSTGDIVAASRDAFRNDSELRLFIQAVSVKLAETVYRMSIFPYFRDDLAGCMDGLGVRAGYLHQAYNEGRRQVAEEAVKLLEQFIRSMPRLAQSAGVVGGFERLRELTRNEGSCQKELLVQWNGIVAAIRKDGRGDFASPEWEKRMWEISGGIARI